MGRLTELTVLKLGGSLITFKDKPLAANLGNIRTVARAISGYVNEDNNKRVFLVHGGGSFGHYFAKKYRLSRKWVRANPEGTSRTSASMIDLHAIVLDELLRRGVNCKTVLTSEILDCDTGDVSQSGKEYIQLLFDSGFVPITFGNVLISKKGARIISGDSIALAVSNSVLEYERRVIFAMDVDGIYPSMNMNSPIIHELKLDSKVSTYSRNFDVTGGIKAKVKAGFLLARGGAEVYFVNGSKRGRLADLLRGRPNVKATRIYPMDTHP